MSTIELAMPTILRQEGHYSAQKNDPGGATNYGISLRFLLSIGAVDHNNLPGGDINHDGKVDVLDIKDMTPEEATQLYYSYFWLPNNYGRIQDQVIATKVFSLSINMIYHAENKCLQRAVRAASGVTLTDDGVIGETTLNAVNACDSKLLLAALKSESAGYYRSIKYAGSEDYLTGWLNRAYD